MFDLKEYQRQYYIAHQETILARSHAYYENHIHAKAKCISCGKPVDLYSQRCQACTGRINGSIKRPSEGRSCPNCGVSLTPIGRQIYCSKRCRANAWAQRHKDQGRRALQLWRQHNPAKRLAQVRRQDKETARLRRAEWRATHPYEARLIAHRRRLKVKGTERISWQKILAKSNGKCGICRRPVRDNDISFDHILPISRGGEHAEYNIQVAHKLCNIRKSAWGTAQLTLPLQME